GVRHRHGVARAAVERLAEVEDLVALLGLETFPEVLSHLPVHRGLERVLHAQRAPGDEERVRQPRPHRDAAEHLDELRELRGIDVGVRGVHECRARERGEEVRVMKLGVVEPDRQRGEEREQVQVVAAGARVMHAPAAALLQVEHQVVAVRQHVAGERGMHRGGCDLRRLHESSPPTRTAPGPVVSTNVASFTVDSTITVRVWRTPSCPESCSSNSACNAGMSATRTFSSSENSPVMWWHSCTASSFFTRSMNPFSKRGCSKKTSTNAHTCAPTAAGSTTAVHRRMTWADSSFFSRSCTAAVESPTRR